MKQKINFRLIFIALVAVLLTALSVTFVNYNLFVGQVRDDLRLNAILLKKAGVFQQPYNRSENIKKDINALALDEFKNGELRITWIAANGIVLYDNEVAINKLSNHFDRPEIREAFSKGEGECVRKSDTINMDNFYYAVLMEDGTVLRVSMKARSITSAFFTSVPMVIGVVLFVLLICVFISNLLTRQLLKPIEYMVDNLDNSNNISVYSELQPLVNKIRSQHEKILMAAKSRQDFTANISHELKTPITAISGYAELIENKLVTGDDEVHVANAIRHNAARLLLMITDIIQLSELDHTELPRKFEQVDLLEIAEECMCDLQPVAAQNSVSLSCCGNSAFINADRRLIREMLDNLVQNAIQYNHENGIVNIIVSDENNHPKISVKDTGIGIPIDQQERVFERFYRVDKSRSRETGGTGLGLAIVKHIVAIHSAEIFMQSTPGEGTVISVNF